MNIVRFSPDGELFCTGSADCKAFLFNGKTAEEVGPLGGDKAHAGGIYGVSCGLPVLVAVHSCGLSCVGSYAFYDREQLCSMKCMRMSVCVSVCVCVCVCV